MKYWKLKIKIRFLLKRTPETTPKNLFPTLNNKFFVAFRPNQNGTLIA